MSRQLQIRRGETEVGILSESEAHELLQAKFLLPTDQFRVAGELEWRLLGELEAANKKKKTSGAAGVLNKITSAGSAAARQAAQLTSKLASSAKSGGAQVTKSTSRMLDAFTPQIQKLVSRQLVQSSMTRLQTAFKDDEFMRKVFGATYDCLPKPVCRFVTEQAFIKYCMDRRETLLKPATPGQ